MFNVSNSCNGHRLGDPVQIWLSWSTSKCPLLIPQNKNSLKVSKYVKPVNEKIKNMPESCMPETPRVYF